MVRLKVSYNGIEEIADVFQFHMVRLKVRIFHILARVAEFQFHMVRLKGFEAFFVPVRQLISIPYGAIKSVYSCSKRKVQSFISIPYGAIKSSSASHVSSPFLTFQFHMVRLKVSTGHSFSETDYISIPYGAIKSFLSSFKFRGLFHISIPYGAIKRTPERVRAQRAFYFNSIWCD